MRERKQETQILGTALAIEFNLPLSVPDVVSKALFSIPVVQLSRAQVTRLIEVLCSGEYNDFL